MTQNIAFLGLGIMGGAMAANLAKAGGLKVKGWNRTAGKPGVRAAAEGGVEIVGTPEEAVTEADVVFLCLGDERDITELLLGPDGLAGKLKSGTLVIDMSTSGPDCARHLNSELEKVGHHFLDAPVSGGDVGARNGTLTIMVGGSVEDFSKALPLFQRMGKNIKHCGPAGSGQIVKLCNQILCAVNMVGVCEALHLAEDLGIDPTLVVEVCGTGAAGSWALTNLGPKIAKHDYQPAFMIKHMLKDLRLVFDAASTESEFPGTNLARKNFETAKNIAGTDGAEEGTQGMMRTYRGV